MKQVRRVLLGAGHGGISPNGNYTTKGKQFYHGGAVAENLLHGNGMFYEGVSNRNYVSQLCAELGRRNVEYVTLSHEWKDTPLDNRIRAGNALHAISPCVYFSFHHDATKNHRARGFSILTSKGQTESDQIAEYAFRKYEERFPLLIARHQRSRDGDSDFEYNIYLLRKLNCPAVLFETNFFDHPVDVGIIQSKSYQKQFVNYVADVIEYVCREDHINLI